MSRSSDRSTIRLCQSYWNHCEQRCSDRALLYSPLISSPLTCSPHITSHLLLTDPLPPYVGSSHGTCSDQIISHSPHSVGFVDMWMASQLWITSTLSSVWVAPTRHSNIDLIDECVVQFTVLCIDREDWKRRSIMCAF